MVIIAFASIKGSPGVTTCAVALARAWQGPVVLVDCDPAGGDIAPYLGVAMEPGLVGLAAAVRRSPDVRHLWEHCQVLEGGLPVVPAPVGAEAATASIRTLVASGVIADLAEAPDVVAVMDCGRLDPDSPALPVIGAATRTVLVVRPRPAGLAHLSARAVGLREILGEAGLVLVGPADFAESEISDTFGLPVWARVPLDSAGAEWVLAPRGTRRAARLLLSRAVRRLADQLRAGLTQLGAPASSAGPTGAPPASDWETTP